MLKPIRRVVARPEGFHKLGELKRQSDSAVLVSYYRWELWIAKAAVVQIEDGPEAGLWAKRSAIDNAKSYAMRRRDGENRTRPPHEDDGFHQAALPYRDD